MSDQHITCSECGGSFVFTESERQFYETKGLSGPPKRCKACRQARKAADPGRGGGFGGRPGAGGGDRGGFRGRDGAPPPRREGGGGFRGRDGGGPPRREGGFAPRGAPREGGFAPRGASREGAPAAGGGWGRVGGGEGARPASRFGGAPGASRFARGRTNGPQDGPRRFDGPRGDAPRGDRPGYEGKRPRLEVREGVGPKPRPAPAEAEAKPRAKKAKAERPKYDVTCKECGTAAQVPFKPIEGRDVFCQPCYRARRPAAPTTEPTLDTPTE